MSYSRVVDHRAMIFDNVRNQFYYDEISKVVNKNSVVLDLGCGLGIHGFMAAKSGAKRVYFVEPEDVIEVAKEISGANNFDSELIFLKGKIEDIELPEKVDLIISVFTGNFLLEEDLLPSLFYARDKYLKKNGKLIPDSANMECVPVSVPDYYQQEIESWSEKNFGIDFSPAKSYVTNHIFYPGYSISPDYLCDPVEFFDLDFYSAKSTELDDTIHFEFSDEANCHGIMGWSDIKIGKEKLSTSPANHKTHWNHAFFPLKEKLVLNKNDKLTLELKRKPFGNWSWKIESGNYLQKSSKLFSHPFDNDSVEKSSMDFKPELNENGKALLSILLEINGNNSNENILAGINEKFPEFNNNKENSKSYLSNLLKNYCK